MADASGGRFILGLGAGWYEPEYTAFGLLFTEKVGRLAETLEALAGPLRGEQVTLSERHLRLRDANVMVSTPPLPIWIAASGPRMLQLTARYADGLERGLVWSGSEPVPAARRRALGSNGRLRPATRCDRDLGQPFRYSGTSRHSCVCSRALRRRRRNRRRSSRLREGGGSARYALFGEGALSASAAQLHRMGGAGFRSIGCRNSRQDRKSWEEMRMRFDTRSPEETDA